MNKIVMAVDVGGVLASKQHDGEPASGAKEALSYLSHFCTLHIVSMCGSSRAIQTHDWLSDHDLAGFFATQTYIPFSHVDKNRELQRLGAQIFVDDRLKHVVPALSLGVRCYHMAPVGAAVSEAQQGNPNYVPVPSWASLINHFEQASLP